LPQRERETNSWRLRSLSALVRVCRIAVSNMSKACPGRPNAYTVRRLRPLARLRLITRRPFFVDMRFKKPCFLARLILLGWYVRFIIHLQSVVMARPFSVGQGIHTRARVYVWLIPSALDFGKIYIFIPPERVLSRVKSCERLRAGGLQKGIRVRNNVLRALFIFHEYAEASISIISYCSI